MRSSLRCQVIFLAEIRRLDLRMISQTIAILSLPPFEVQREWSWVSTPPDGWSIARSYAYICPVCLKQWAVTLLEGDQEYVIQAAYCERHHPANWNPTWCVPGSILVGHGDYLDWPLLDVLPEELLRREFNLAMKEIERGILISG